LTKINIPLSSTLMQHTLSSLSKKAIDAALKAEWDSAVELNSEILSLYPNDIATKLRLGRALIQTRQFPKATKVFKEVLDKDPINSVALKNLDLAKNHQTDAKTNEAVNTRSLLMEPGKCTECIGIITAKGITAREFAPGEELYIRVKKKSLELIKIRKGTKVSVGMIDNPEVVRRANEASDMDGKFTAAFVKGEEKMITILLRSTIPVFRSGRQEIRPYIKKGTLDDEETPPEGSEVAQ